MAAGYQLPFWVAAREWFAEAVFGVVVECPTFPQPCTWYLMHLVLF